MDNIKDKIVKTAQGHFAIWEEGGGMTNTGHATIITGPNGEKLEPVYIKLRGNLSCGEHALFLLKQGMWVICVDRKHDQYETNIYHYEGTELISLSYLTSIEISCPSFLEAVIKIAKEKTRHYHCREPYYFIKKEELCDIKH